MIVTCGHMIDRYLPIFIFGYDNLFRIDYIDIYICEKDLVILKWHSNRRTLTVKEMPFVIGRMRGMIVFLSVALFESCVIFC